WRDRLAEGQAALANVPRAFSLLWEAAPGGTVGLSAITLIDAAYPAAQAWAGKMILDGVVTSIKLGRSPADGVRAVAPYLALELGLVLARNVGSSARQLVQNLIDLRLGYLVTGRIVRKALTLEMRWFEDPEFYDKLQNARRQSEYRAMTIVNEGFFALQNALSLISFLAILLAFNPWIALVLCAAAIPTFIVQTRFSRDNFRLQTWRAPETREMNYIEQLLTMDDAVEEVKLFELGETLLKEHGQTFWKTFHEDAALARGRTLYGLLWGTLSTVAYYGAWIWVIRLAVAGTLTLGGMTFYIALFSQSQSVFQGLLSNVANLFENGLFLKNLFDFLDLPGESARPLTGPRPIEDPSRGVEFDHVWFRYPKAEKWILEDFSLTIKPGEKLALVGENGAGKTTLIKLLTRLYEPERGAVRLNGVDLRDFAPQEIHRRVGAIFQDYVRYQRTLGENVGFGAIEKAGDDAAVAAAGRKSGADEVAAGLKKGYASRLGRWFDDGHDLSGGQWQKVALGRAFMRDGQVLILDEPTSSLDAEAEAAVFERMKALAAGKTALLVSHRFSTVRMADRILVLKNGRIEEIGSHDELIALGGTYARLFELQARGYR
ncbi:MAG: ABC transporter ATP-binding protein, partial [Elusimicrobia bacterium]|nr:ABC transporter ATP-binding protein [Elusimicrobiota bacterium]